MTKFAEVSIDAYRRTLTGFRRGACRLELRDDYGRRAWFLRGPRVMPFQDVFGRIRR